MSNDNDKSSQAPPPEKPSEPRRQEPAQDLFSTVRRFADEHISAALHSVFGIPSILQTPANSNWIVEDGDRNPFDDVNRREGTDSSNRDDDNAGDNKPGNNEPGASGYGGSSGSSGQQGSSPSSSPSSSDRKRDDNSDDLLLPRSLMPPMILLPQLLVSLGIQSADILERNLGSHVEGLERLIAEESARQKEIAASKHRPGFSSFQKEFQRLFELEAASLKKAASTQNEEDAPGLQAIVIKGVQAGDEPRFTITRISNKPSTSSPLPQHQQRSSFWRELFGEDMYGSQRTHPLFTSLFDEFLPDGSYARRRQPPSAIGGWRFPNQSEMPPLAFPADPFGQFFKLVTGPWIRTMNENWDPTYQTAAINNTNQIITEKTSSGREAHGAVEESNRLSQEEHLRLAQERVRRLMRWQELEKLMRGEEDDIANPMPEKDALVLENGSTKQDEEDQTELDMHKFFVSIGEKKDGHENKVLVSQSMSTTSTTGADGITRVKKVRERRYSDGTVEREEHHEETASSQSPHPFANHFRILDQLKNHEGTRRRAGTRKVIELEGEEGEETKAIAEQTEDVADDETKKGGWGSWMWASGKKD